MLVNREFSPSQTHLLIGSCVGEVFYDTTSSHTHQVYAAERLEGEDHKDLHSKNYCPNGMFELVALLLQVWPVKYQKRSGFLSQQTFQGPRNDQKNPRNYGIRWARNPVCNKINHKHEAVQICIGTRGSYLLSAFLRKQTKNSESKKVGKSAIKVWSRPANWSASRLGRIEQ